MYAGTEIKYTIYNEITQTHRNIKFFPFPSVLGTFPRIFYVNSEKFSRLKIVAEYTHGILMLAVLNRLYWILFLVFNV